MQQPEIILLVAMIASVVSALALIGMCIMLTSWPQVFGKLMNDQVAASNKALSQAVETTKQRIDVVEARQTAALTKVLSASTEELAGYLAQGFDALKKESVEVRKTNSRMANQFLKAEEGFRALADAIRDIENLDEIRDRVDAASANFETAVQGIHGQVAQTAGVVQNLDQLVVRWAREGSDLQKVYERLADAVVQALARDAANARQRAGQVEARVLQHTDGGNDGGERGLRTEEAHAA